ncbi:unnamed protein product, partial [Lampetra planeri]
MGGCIGIHSQVSGAGGGWAGEAVCVLWGGSEPQWSCVVCLCVTITVTPRRYRLQHTHTHTHTLPALHAEAHSGRLTQKKDRPLLTDVSSSRQSLQCHSVLPDVPVISGVEESPTEDQDDKEELEFPHDLLPSLDFSSELNIWESSLGPLPSLESPQPEHLTSTEEVAAPQEP